MIPYIKNDDGIQTLFVHDKPFIALAGEIHNSSSSDLTYMENRVWPMLQDLHMNTVILPVAWESIEPQEGTFDFSLVDGLITQARRENMKLVILWFGLWKNSESYYTPAWVKKDTDTYFRVVDAQGKKLQIVSPFCQAAVEKDANAYGQLMTHIKALDEEENTVIVMQIENEIGVLGAERDFSSQAQAIYDCPVPEDIKAFFAGDSHFPANTEGSSWEEVFGENGPELFMAWGYAGAIEKIAEAGQAIYPLPMYVNAWLEQHPWRPGTYPCGGPVMKVKKMWKHCAPALFTLAPDIYVPYTADVLDEYTAEDNPLFVPEIRKDAQAVSYLLYAVMHNHAIAVSPFGIEDLNTPPEMMKMPPMAVLMALNIDVNAMDGGKTAPYLSAVYNLIEQMTPLYLNYRHTPHLKSFVKRSDVDDGIMLSFEKYDIVISYNRQENGKPLAAGVIYELAEDRFLMSGMNYSFKIYPKVGVRAQAVICSAVEGQLQSGQFVPGRVLNGDERMRINMGDMPENLMVDVYSM